MKENHHRHSSNHKQTTPKDNNDEEYDKMNVPDLRPEEDNENDGKTDILDDETQDDTNWEAETDGLELLTQMEELLDENSTLKQTNETHTHNISLLLEQITMLTDENENLLKQMKLHQAPSANNTTNTITMNDTSILKQPKEPHPHRQQEKNEMVEQQKRKIKEQANMIDKIKKENEHLHTQLKQTKEFVLNKTCSNCRDKYQHYHCTSAATAAPLATMEEVLQKAAAQATAISSILSSNAAPASTSNETIPRKQHQTNKHQKTELTNSTYCTNEKKTSDYLEQNTITTSPSSSTTNKTRLVAGGSGSPLSHQSSSASSIRIQRLQDRLMDRAIESAVMPLSHCTSTTVNHNSTNSHPKEKEVEQAVAVMEKKRSNTKKETISKKKASSSSSDETIKKKNHLGRSWHGGGSSASRHHKKDSLRSSLHGVLQNSTRKKKNENGSGPTLLLSRSSLHGMFTKGSKTKKTTDAGTSLRSSLHGMMSLRKRHSSNQSHYSTSNSSTKSVHSTQSHTSSSNNNNNKRQSSKENEHHHDDDEQHDGGRLASTTTKNSPSSSAMIHETNTAADAAPDVIVPFANVNTTNSSTKATSKITDHDAKNYKKEHQERAPVRREHQGEKPSRTTPRTKASTTREDIEQLLLAAAAKDTEEEEVEETLLEVKDREHSESYYPTKAGHSDHHNMSRVGPRTKMRRRRASNDNGGNGGNGTNSGTYITAVAGTGA